MQLWHGTGGKNVTSIIENGFDERLAKGGFYGAGIYFTDDPKKADEFVFGPRFGGCWPHKKSSCNQCERHILLCKVNMGNAYFAPVPDGKYDEGERAWGHPHPGYNR